MATNFFHGGHFQPAHQHQPHQQHPHGPGSHNHHGGRSRRGPRLGAPHNQQPNKFRNARSMKELAAENPTVTAFRSRFEAGRSFDLEDDLEFCPGLLTDEDLQSIHSASSDRSSLSSGSPDSSPMQTISHPSSHITPSISLPSTTNSSYTSPPQFNNHQLKLHQPSAIRSRNAIPIVNPSTGVRISSPPSSISPGMMQHAAIGRRW